MVIVDSTIWVDYFRGVVNPETSWLDQQIPLQRLGLTTLILCEVLQGIRDGNTFGRISRELLSFQVFDVDTSDLAIAAAENYRSLRSRGYTVRRTIDCLIATFCLKSDHQLLHRDRDFEVFERMLGLRVVHA